MLRVPGVPVTVACVYGAAVVLAYDDPFRPEPAVPYTPYLYPGSVATLPDGWRVRVYDVSDRRALVGGEKATRGDES